MFFRPRFHDRQQCSMICASKDIRGTMRWACIIAHYLSQLVITPVDIAYSDQKVIKTVNYIQFSGIKILEMGTGFLSEICFHIYLKWRLNRWNRLNNMTTFHENYTCYIVEEPVQWPCLSFRSPVRNLSEVSQDLWSPRIWSPSVDPHCYNTFDICETH